MVDQTDRAQAKVVKIIIEDCDDGVDIGLVLPGSTSNEVLIKAACSMLATLTTREPVPGEKYSRQVSQDRAPKIEAYVVEQYVSLVEQMMARDRGPKEIFLDPSVDTNSISFSPRELSHKDGRPAKEGE
jgi:hypothetical protein